MGTPRAVPQWIIAVFYVNFLLFGAIWLSERGHASSLQLAAVVAGAAVIVVYHVQRMRGRIS